MFHTKDSYSRRAARFAGRTIKTIGSEVIHAVTSIPGPTQTDDYYNVAARNRDLASDLASLAYTEVVPTQSEEDTVYHTRFDEIRNEYNALLGNQIHAATGTNGSDPNGPPRDKYWKIDSCTGQLVPATRRRRRKRLLSCSDKADLAFLVGTLGKGSIASTAISSLLAKCN